MKKLLSLVVIAGFVGMVVGCAAETPKAPTKPAETKPAKPAEGKPAEGK